MNKPPSMGVYDHPFPMDGIVWHDVCTVASWDENGIF